MDGTQTPLPSQCPSQLDLPRREVFSALFIGEFFFFFFLLFCRETILGEQNQCHLQVTLLNSHWGENTTTKGKQNEIGLIFFPFPQENTIRMLILNDYCEEVLF